MTVYASLLKYQPKEDELKSKFRKWHVESLLNQAVDLLEKCLEEERQYRSLLFTSLQFQLDLNSELNALEFEEKKISQDYFKREKIISEIDRAGLSETEVRHKILLAFSEDLNSRSGALGFTILEQNRLTQDFFDRFNEDVTRRIRSEILDKKILWLDEDEKNIIDQTQKRRDLYKEKLDATNEKRPFNLSKPIEQIAKRLQRNYEDGYARLSVAKEGLELIYNYDIIDLPNVEENLISELLIWNRNAIEWLAAYQQRDQGITRTISIRSLIGQTEWDKLGISLETGEAETSFYIPATYFNGYENVRLRGIGASIIGAAGLYPWTITIKVPEKAIFYRNNKDIVRESKRNQTRLIDQSKMPFCMLGRVENRMSKHPVEISGMISLMNASPIGEPKILETDEGKDWIIKIYKPSVPINTSASKSETFTGIDDLLIQLNVVGIPITT
ncbi:hypothetical protein GCM10028818_54010 [Spirosoma horti]